MANRPKLVRAVIGNRNEVSVSPSENNKVIMLSITLSAKFQQYYARTKDPADHFDRDIYSPKSVRSSMAVSKVYVNSLEGLSTLVYDPATLLKKGKIAHRFDRANEDLFIDDLNNVTWALFPNNSKISSKKAFSGKPVEFAETHGGRYLWSSYYRRSYDMNAILPSAVAVIDTEKDEIVRVMSTGPLPKSIATSPNGKWLSVIHWGDNTIGFIDVSGNNAASFKHDSLVTVERKYTVKSDIKVNRDKACGFCLRGGVFTPDSRYLLVGRMKGGGIAVIDVEKKAYIGTVYGMKPTPRHLVLSPDGETLYLSSNVSGYVSSYPVADLVKAALGGIKKLKARKEVSTGVGTRTIDLSPDGRFLFAAVKYASKVAVIDTEQMKVIMNVPVDSYPVGLDVSPDGKQLWVTSQGAKGYGGNSVNVFKLSIIEE
ncbi:MAG: beta-propeller fold lactonase family protein [Proteobacteria bacterium]|nr:beta-propeller fold lactonase family protein [Pseudomonadota bacterium]